MMAGKTITTAQFNSHNIGQQAYLTRRSPKRSASVFAALVVIAFGIVVPEPIAIAALP